MRGTRGQGKGVHECVPKCGLMNERVCMNASWQVDVCIGCVLDRLMNV